MSLFFHRFPVVPIVALLAGTSSPSFAQQTAAIGGLVSDPTAAAVAGAKVELVSGLAAPRSVATDSEGRYRFEGLPPGEYTVRVTAPGFELVERQVKVASSEEPAFSDQATMFSVGADGKLAGGAIQNLFDGVDKDFRPSPEAQGAIVRIEIVGTAASARIDANDVSGFCFTDFFPSPEDRRQVDRDQQNLSPACRSLRALSTLSTTFFCLQAVSVRHDT